MRLGAAARASGTPASAANSCPGAAASAVSQFLESAQWRNPQWNGLRLLFHSWR